jgi:hypothetical protein
MIVEIRLATATINIRPPDEPGRYMMSGARKVELLDEASTQPLR